MIQGVQHVRVIATLLFVLNVCAGCGSPDSSSSSRDLSAWMGTNGNTNTFKKVDGTHNLVFPEDHGPHKEYLFEWWYLTALLADTEGHEFGTQFTIFRRTLSINHEQSNSWRSGQIYSAHFALSDMQQEIHRSAERFSRAHPKLAGARSDPFRVFVDDWKLASSGSTFFPL